MTVAARSAPDPLLGTVVADRYLVEHKLGEGGMGSVYRALDKRLNRLVALKIIRPELLSSQDTVQRFRREAQVTASFVHPNAVSIYDVDTTAHGLMYMALEFVDGVELRHVLRRDGPLPPARAIKIANQVLAALGAAHRAGIVHRDLKPQNIMVAAGDKVKLLDFGIARPQESGATLTLAGQIVGTVAYMSPEQVVGTRLDGRSDLYSLAVVLFQLLTGRLPFSGNKPVDVMEAHRDQAPPRLRSIRPDLPESLEPVMARALAKLPEERYQTAEELAAALEALVGGPPPAPSPPPPAPPPGPAVPIPSGHTPISQAYDAAGSTDAFYQGLVGRNLGDYVIEAQLGEGGMGAVFKAKDALLGNHFAIKVIHPSLANTSGVRERFLREARAAQEVVHPNAVPIRGCHAAPGGLLYMVLDFCPGETLRATLRREGRMPPERALGIVRQALMALGEAHAKGIVHRDLKPENLMLERDEAGEDWVRVVDFGLAKLRESPAERKGESLTGNQVVGTPHYMSPEQVESQAVDARTDVYSLGCVLYELLTGVRPFVGEGAFAVMKKHVTEPVVPPSQRTPEAAIRADVEALVLQAMEKDPRRRFQSADEMLLAIDRLGYRLPGRHNRTSGARLVNLSSRELATPRDHDLASAATLAQDSPTAPPAHVRAQLEEERARSQREAEERARTQAAEQTRPPDRKAAPTERRIVFPTPPPRPMLPVVVVALLALGGLLGAGAVLWRHLSSDGRVAVSPDGPQPPLGGPSLPPVEQPPVEQPPVEQPPVEQPPVEQPPVEQPPVEKPPVEQPPVEQPPVEKPPVEQPPVEQPPVEQPPVEQPPVEQPPVEKPPVEKPPPNPLSNPPLEPPPTEKPPLEQPPVETPPPAEKPPEVPLLDRPEVDWLRVPRRTSASGPYYFQVARTPISVRQYGWFALDVLAGKGGRVNEKKLLRPLAGWKAFRADAPREDVLRALPEDQAIRGVDHAIASRVAQYYGGRLPRQEEWEHLARARVEQSLQFPLQSGVRGNPAARPPEWLIDPAVGIYVGDRVQAPRKAEPPVDAEVVIRLIKPN